MLAATEDWYNRGGQSPGCLLTHIIITTIWNLLLKGKVGDSGLARAPRVKDVVSRLVTLGYDRDAIIETMHALYLHNNSRQNLVEFRCRSVISSSEQVTDDIPVYLTYRGKCLAARTAGSFGYLYDCLRLLEGGSPGEEMLISHPSIRSTGEIVNKLMPYLCDVAQMHYLTLKDWQAKKVFGEQQWPYVYIVLAIGGGIQCVAACAQSWIAWKTVAISRQPVSGGSAESSQVKELLERIQKLEERLKPQEPPPRERAPNPVRVSEQ